jgi:hypothetical protein
MHPCGYLNTRSLRQLLGFDEILRVQAQFLGLDLHSHFSHFD